ncbi:hypothetical protein ACKKBG_A24555 [Auxenochlorella protothecoides x Auxenochlorella symbiontica]
MLLPCTRVIQRCWKASRAVPHGRCYATTGHGTGSALGRHLIITDAHAWIYRSHHAMPKERLKAPDGTDTTTVHLFLGMLWRLLRLNPQATHVAAVFDFPGKNFRHQMYPDYKAHRKATPPEIKQAGPQLRSLLAQIGIPVLCVPGVEADDVIASLAVRGIQDGMTVGIASPDGDFRQLLQPGLTLLRPAPRGKAAYVPGGPPSGLLAYAAPEFEADFPGLRPDQYADLLALSGDASDNIPGVPGVGPVGAARLLAAHGGVEGVLAAARAGGLGGARASKRTAATLAGEEGAAAARLSLRLTRLVTNLDVPATRAPWDAYRPGLPADGGEAALRTLGDLALERHARTLRAVWAEHTAFRR